VVRSRLSASVLQRRIVGTSVSPTALLPSWELALESDNKSPKTIKSYLASVRALTAFLAANDMPAGVDDVMTESIRAFLVAERERTTRRARQQHYRNLSVFWNWLAAEGERTGENPMARVSKPEVPVKMKPFFTEDDLARHARSKIPAAGNACPGAAGPTATSRPQAR
jgi:site-specific recombinase XerD